MKTIQSFTLDLSLRAVMIYACISSLLIFLATGCGNQNNLQPASHSSIQVTDSLKASFEILDSDGKYRTSLKEGEPFTLSFNLQNIGGKSISIGPWTFPITQKNFFAVIKNVPGENATQFIGKPFDAVGSSYDLTSQVVPAKTTIIYQIPWQTQLDKAYEMPIYNPQVENRLRRVYSRTQQQIPTLTKGSYQSSFTLSIEGKQMTFNAAFTIE